MLLGASTWVLLTALILTANIVAVISATLEDKTFWRNSALRDIQQTEEKERIEGPAKNIIIFVGDGMGVITHTLARIYKGQKEGKTGEEGHLFWEKFPYNGLIKTYNTDYQVSDSAGTATAIFSGVKTNLGVLGVDSTVSRNSCDPSTVEKGKVKSILHWGVASNKRVGIVTTARLTHATPGAVYSHTPNRDWEADVKVPQDKKQCRDIASQLVDQFDKGTLTLAMGGGLRNFRTTQNGGLRQDRDLVDYLESKGVQVVTQTGELKKWDYQKPLVGLFGDSHMDYEIQRDKSDLGQPSLTEMTRQAINVLSKGKDGFVLMVESGRIDHAHHQNQAKLALEETVELDRAVKAALDMVDVKETLILVTADHSHAVTMSGYPTRGNNVLGTVYNLESGYLFMKTNENKTQPYQTISYANGPGNKDHFDSETGFWRNISQMNYLADEYRQPSMFHLDYETHGGEDVAVYARGPQAHLVNGLHDQSYLGVLMGYAGCINKAEFGCPKQQNSSASNRTGLSRLTVLLAILFNLYAFH